MINFPFITKKEFYALFPHPIPTMRDFHELPTIKDFRALPTRDDMTVLTARLADKEDFHALATLADLDEIRDALLKGSKAEVAAFTGQIDALRQELFPAMETIRYQERMATARSDSANHMMGAAILAVQVLQMALLAFIAFKIF
jgi:hypothetical protein